MYKRQSTMNELDVQLIREFALRPIIYNKAAPFFKNKYLTDIAWDEIAAKVGGDVNRVRDRVNQLRNRYNLEKRKVDVQKQEGFPNARSTWPLFDHLRFLDGHIRPRKSYKSLGRRLRPVGRPRKVNPYENDVYARYNGQTQYTNPIALQRADTLVQVKTEPGLSRHSETNAEQSEYDSDGNENYQTRSEHKSNSDGEQFINPASFLVENDDSITETSHNPNENGGDSNAYSRKSDSQPNQSINLSLRSLNSLRNQDQPMTNGSRQHSTIALDSESEASVQQTSHRRTFERNPSSAKFDAFGNFVATSLIDMPERMALELVEKFTSEIVKSLIAAKTPANEEK